MHSEDHNGEVTEELVEHLNKFTEEFISLMNKYQLQFFSLSAAPKSCCPAHALQTSFLLEDTGSPDFNNAQIAAMVSALDAVITQKGYSSIGTELDNLVLAHLNKESNEMAAKAFLAQETTTNTVS